MKKSILISLTLLLVLSMVMIVYPGNASSQSDSASVLEDYGSLTEVASFHYGKGEEEIGYTPAGYETLDVGPTSFYVLGDTIYILDNVNKKVLIKNANNKVRTISVKNACWLKDIYVTPEAHVFLLDSCKKQVEEFDENGQKINDFMIPATIDLPYELGMNNNRELYVREPGSQAIVLKNSKKFAGISFLNHDENVIPSMVDNKTGSLDIGDTVHIEIPYQYSFGELKVHGISKDTITISKTEVAPDIPVVVAESFIQKLDFNGNVIGTIRIPTEKMNSIPDQMVRLDNNVVYLFSLEKDLARIYKVHLGRKYETKIDQLIESQKSRYNPGALNKADDYVPLGDTGPNGYLHRSTASSRASTMINFGWTIKTGNLVEQPNTTLPSFLSSKSVGDQVTSIPYKWGGADGVNEGAGGRSSFLTYQSQGKQTGDINTNKSGGISSVTGVDCSGFVGLAWYRTDQKYSTSTLSQITDPITKSNLKNMDALNAVNFHTVLYTSSSTDGIYTKEATTDNGGRSQNYFRSWTWLQNKGFTYIRYKRIVDDGNPLPQPYNKSPINQK